MAALSLSLRNLSRVYGAAGVRDLNLEIHAGEGFSILGPSGCGKTTTLRLIAGFETPDTGSIHLGDRDITALPPQKRDIRTVFQRYALFPHLNVFENIAFGLRMRKVPESEIRRRVDAAIELTGTGPLRARQVTGLSGGEQQRVALARALVNEPAVMLLDEPLSALDLKLRERMQGELLALRRRLGKTFVFVTHDQGEAMFLSDRIAVLNHGRLEQVGTPQEIYEKPATTFVASFIGQANFICPATAAHLGGAREAMPSLKEGERWVVRPERVRRLAAQETLRDGEVSLKVTIGETVFLGQDRVTNLRAPGGLELTMRRPGFEALPGQTGDEITVIWEAKNAWKIHDTAAG